jgi:hypothetical protein
MTEKIFISGSIKIKTLSKSVYDKLEQIIKEDQEVIVGDAAGVDSSVQDFFKEKEYRNVTVYSIFSIPRHNSGGFESKYVFASGDIKSMRERQKVKDERMSIECDSSLVIWDGKSKGCFSNIKRSINLQKPIRVFLWSSKDFIEQCNISENSIDNIYRSSVGYSATETLELLKKRAFNGFDSTRAFNKFLLDNNIIQKEKKIYHPQKDYQQYFITNKHLGKVTGINFKIEFLDWFEETFSHSKNLKTPEFDFG